MAQPVTVAVVGAGAAGLATAIFAAEKLGRGQVVLLDGAARVGAKILVSGGGRCNVTHHRVTAADFAGKLPIVRNVLRHFDEQATVRWFESLGVPLKREPTGKLFPISDDAHTVLEALLRRCSELGVAILTQHRVHDLRPPAEPGLPWTVEHEQGELQARRVVMATGGRSLPRTGSDGAGWRIVQRLGHTVTPTCQALVPLVLADDFFHAQVSGISLEVGLRVTAEGRTVDQRTGSLLWTHFGVSGPVVMDASRHWVLAQESGRRAGLLVNLLPGRTFDDVERRLVEATAQQPRRPVRNLLNTWLPERLAAALLEHLALDGGVALGQWLRESRRKLVHGLVELSLPVVKPRGWNYAEVTAGGVPLDEVDHRTMASRRVLGLFLVGEMLDCDGRIGGFNFQWAWSTAHLAGGGASVDGGF